MSWNFTDRGLGSSVVLIEPAMKVLILAAGYGTRLTRDIEETNGRFAHLKGVAKPLLPIGEKALISHWMDIFDSCPETHDDIYVVVSADTNFFKINSMHIYYCLVLCKVGEAVRLTTTRAPNHIVHFALV